MDAREARPGRSNRPPEGWVSVQIWMPRELRDALKRAAIDRGSNVSEILRSLAARALAPDPAQPAGAGARTGAASSSRHSE